MYTSEISHKSLRNFCGPLQSAMISVGLIAASMVGYLADWRVTTFVVATVPAVTSAAMIWQPESPYWLIKKDRDLRAR